MLTANFNLTVTALPTVYRYSTALFIAPQLTPTALPAVLLLTFAAPTSS